MRYWVYINDKVDGPYDETKLVTLNGFSQNTLICSEEVASSGGQEWVKASSIFEFDEVPVQESNSNIPPATANNVPDQTTNALNESLLLSKLDSLTEELSHLHHRLDTLQTDLDKALEQNEKLSQQIASQTSALTTPVSAVKEEPAEIEKPAEIKEEASAPVETKLPEEVTLPSDEENKNKEDGNFPEQAAPKEEELIIRSALDSIYGDKPLAQPIVEETFQDLLPEKEEEKVEKIEEELTFTPVEEKQEEPAVKQEPVVKEALITTPSAEEISRDELINELTASPKEDILDQIIQEHQEQKATSSSSDSTEKQHSLSGAAVVGIAALGGLAAGAALTGSEEKSQKVPVENSSANSFSMATDKNNPAVLEEVLPPDQMPPDVSKPEEKPLEQPHIDLDPLPTAAVEAAPTVEEKEPDFSDMHEDTVQELVPGAVLEKEQKNEEPDGIYEKPIEEIQEEPQARSTGELTEKDLEDAFGPQEEPMSPTLTEVADNQSPNDLTEIELKEGSTYLISDFVPPAQVGDDSAAMEALGATFNQSLNKQQETIIQDMLAVSNKAEKTQMLPTDGLPEDIEATKISLENTIQAKRGASLDIKTAPMVPEPANTPRLDVSELDDVNAQHEIKTSKSGTKLTKIVLGALIGFLLLIVLYVALGILNLLPQSVNLFSKKQAAAAAPVANELLQENSQAFPEEEEEEEYSVEAEEMGQVLSDVQNISLSNGFTLKEFVESKHAAISKDLISWEVADAVEPDNYSITVKIPPENPQNFKTVYRFNYNMENGLLEPTISDAKNLLDQAEGQA